MKKKKLITLWESNPSRTAFSFTTTRTIDKLITLIIKHKMMTCYIILISIQTMEGRKKCMNTNYARRKRIFREVID